MQRLSARLRLWGDALAGMDDPLGEYLPDLEERVRRLESDVEQLRKLSSAHAATSQSISRAVPLQKHKHDPDPRAKEFE